MGLLSKLARLLARKKPEQQCTTKELDDDDGFMDNPFSHPELTNSLISKILENLDFEQLKICRLVCTHWDQVLRETKFSDENVCFQFCLFEREVRKRDSVGAPLSSPQPQQCSNSNPSTSKTVAEDNASPPPVPKLKVSTIRIRDTSRDVPRKGGPSLTILDLQIIHPFLLDGLTRLEIEPLPYPRDVNLWDLHRVLLVLPRLNNIVELIITQPEKSDWSHPTGFEFSLEKLERKYKISKYHFQNVITKLKKLKKLVFSVDNSDTPEYFLFLKVVAEICEKLEDFQIFINYSKIWPVEFARQNLFKIIGMILEHNAPTLQNVVISTRNTFWCDEKLNFTRIGDSYNDAVRNSLEHGNWYLNYASFATNEMFEKLCQEMKVNRWEYFGLNVLKNLTLEFPIPVLPCPEIDSGLKPFLDSLGNLKTLKIQPIVARRNLILGDLTYEPLSYLNGILQDPTNKFKFESNLIFFADSDEIDWTPLTWRCQRSRMDMVFKEAGPETKSVKYSPRRVLWRNVPWKNIKLAEVLTPQGFTNLIHLAIHQNTSCTLGHVLSMNDLDLQLILKNGRSLQYLALSCDLSRVTPFGYAGYKYTGCDSLEAIRTVCLRGHCSPLRDKMEHTFFDLKDLKTLILIGLKAHFPTEPTHEKKKTEFDFIFRYFVAHSQIHYLLLGFEGMHKCMKNEWNRSRVFFS